MARGDVLGSCADSRPPRGPSASSPGPWPTGTCGGAFAHRFRPAWSLAAINTINRVRYRLTCNYYGDQGIFVRAAIFRKLGGYPDVALMEDLMLSQRLKRRGKPALVATPLYTSGRRFLARGPWRTFALIVWLLVLHTIGLDTQRYASRWRGPRTSPGGPWSPSAPWPLRDGWHGRTLITGATGHRLRAARAGSSPGRAVTLLAAATARRPRRASPPPRRGAWCQPGGRGEISAGPTPASAPAT